MTDVRVIPRETSGAPFKRRHSMQKTEEKGRQRRRRKFPEVATARGDRTSETEIPLSNGSSLFLLRVPFCFFPFSPFSRDREAVGHCCLLSMLYKGAYTRAAFPTSVPSTKEARVTGFGSRFISTIRSRSKERKAITEIPQGLRVKEDDLPSPYIFPVVYARQLNKKDV